MTILIKELRVQIEITPEKRSPPPAPALSERPAPLSGMVEKLIRQYQQQRRW